MFKKQLIMISLIGLYLLISGCAPLLVAGGAGAGAGGVIWYKGELRDTLNASVPHARLAVITSLKDLNLSILEEKKDNLVVKIKSQFADGKKIWISLESLNKTTAKIKIRVGTLGDEYRSRRILELTKKHL
jgi:hypothetical protein